MTCGTQGDMHDDDVEATEMAGLMALAEVPQLCSPKFPTRWSAVEVK